ncbi:Dipeptidyl aminopeptidase [Haplosporangium sp. Z 767]|nr:Dipeptidyl aminopeptidase [Haplosporangium sp. Z 767]KAF9184453.1 Dipeptidyl aminopeptidase [Haplosporangium sp. Z 11]
MKKTTSAKQSPSEKTSGIVQKNPSTKIQKPSIVADDLHVHYLKDGKEHHVTEQDDLDRHNIRHHNFSENEDQPSHIHGNHMQARGGAYDLCDGDIVQHLAAESSKHRPSERLRPESPLSARVESPLATHVKHTQRKHSRDGKDNHEIEDEGHDHHHLRFSDSTSMDDDSTSASFSLPSPNTAKATRRPPSSKTGLGSKVAHSEMASVQHIDSVAVDRECQQTTIHRHIRGNSTMATTTTATTTTTRNDHYSAPNESRHREHLLQDDAATRALTQKSLLDRQKARDAVLSLDHDVVMLQKLLKEKEDALRDAEARAAEFKQATIRTETLTSEIHELEITIRDLRSTLASKDKALKESHNLRARDQKEGKAQEKLLQNEIAALNIHLKAKEHVQQHVIEVQKELDEVNAQRARLLVQIHEMTESLRDREEALRGAETNITVLERSNRNHSEDKTRLMEELAGLKKTMAEKERDLKESQQKVKALEGAQEKSHALSLKIKDLKDQLSAKETCLKNLNKVNKSLLKDAARAEDLVEQVRILKADIKDNEFHLDEAYKSMKDLGGYKDRAIQSERELKDLQEQVVVQEKHLTYLEDALEAHENCAFETQNLQTQLQTLDELLHEKEREIETLRKANKELEQKDTRIETLQSEMQTILHEMESKEQAAFLLKENADQDMAKVCSTASILKTEVEGLQQQLKERTQELEHAHKDLEEFAEEKNKNMSLTIEITCLEKTIADKDRQRHDLENVIDTMKQHSNRANQLEGEVKELQKEVRLSQKTADQTAKDLATASSTAARLEVEVESLREQLNQREMELVHAEKNANDLEDKKNKIEELMSRMNSLEESSQHHLHRARQAEHRSKTLETEIEALEARLADLQHQLRTKEADLQAAVENANKDHVAALRRLEDSQIVVADLKKQLKDVEEESKLQISVKEDELRVLQNEIYEWENHEEGWVNKTTDLTMELERGVDRTRHKEKAFQDLRHKLTDQNAELSRLNTVINDTRRLLQEDRKRRASDIEEQVRERTDQFHKGNMALKKTISGLKDQVHHLEKRIRLDHDHENRERDLAEQIRELIYWKQNSIEQTKEWETTVRRLKKEREQQVATLVIYERKIRTLQAKVNEADEWREHAIGQAEKLTATIKNLEKELRMLKGVLARHDAKDAEVLEQIHSLQAHIASFEGIRDELNCEILAKDEQIVELEGHLEAEVCSFKTGLAGARRELHAKDNEIAMLNSCIAEYTRLNADLELRISKDKDSLSALEYTLDKLRASLAAQMDKYKTLDGKYRATLTIQANQDQQLLHLEKKLKRTASEESEQQQRLLTKNRQLEKELDQALQKVDGLQIEIHKVTRTYHDTLSQLENAKVKMLTMVSAKKANHDRCAANIQSREKEVARLSARIVDLQTTVVQLTKDQSIREKEWSQSESDHKDRVQSMTKARHSLESQLRDTEKSRDLERLGREQDRLRAERERHKLEETNRQLKSASEQMKKEFSLLETRMRQEMSTTKDLTDLLSKVRHNIKCDSEESRSLDELEKELKSRESVVEESIQYTRRRMDSEWTSPIDVNFITSSTSRISNLRKNEHTGDLFWIEVNAATNGRQTIMIRTADGNTSELTPEPFIARTHVHEYGGGVFTLGRDFLVSSNDADCRLYKINTATREMTPITPENNLWRYADVAIHPSEKFLVCVREDHTIDTPQTVVNTLVVVRLDTLEPNVEILAEGADFYAAPRFNPANSSEMAYISWNHPFMVWDHTQLYYTYLDISDADIKLASQTLLTGADKNREESTGQPRFAADGTLYFVSDKTGFWNIYSYRPERGSALVLAEPLMADFQGPNWAFAPQDYYPLKSDASKLICNYTKDGVDHLAVIDTKSKSITTISTEFLVIDGVYASTDGTDDVAIMFVSSYDIPTQVISYNLRTNEYEILMKSSSVDVPKAYISKPEALTFKTNDAYAFYYPPTNADYVGPEGALPPLRVLSHGGPTSAFTPELSWSINYFTSRGIACVAVNYGGSSRYGREFRDRLRGLWGVVDVDDCCNAAKYLVQRGYVDGNKLAIVGGSAGGYTTLACLAFRDVFKAGVSHYGIGNMETLAKETHKFELRYPENLVGPYPEAIELYRERSPLYSADKITCPCAFFQGGLDKIVPPNQAETMVNDLKERGLPVAYVLFDDEGHGFRIPKNVKMALQGEVTFLGRVFGFTPFDAVPLEIANENAIGK